MHFWIAERARQRRMGGMFWGMRVKTSVTIDESVLRAIDKATNRTRSRSRVIEDAAREFLARRARTAREARDLEILNAAADALNQEMDDVLAYQAEA
jgi:metal-responsive CopG/Arc/MetJ family transcriptional regulator